MKKLLILVLAIVWSLALKAQTADQLLNAAVVTPPNSAAFTQYAKVPVGEFTGIPDVKIPLYTIKVDNLSIPIYLSYYARGVQPNVHSGWVGTGWNLVGNGVITRKINGLSDEYCSDGVTFPSPAGNSQYGWYFGANHTQSYSVTNVLGNLVTSDVVGDGNMSKIYAIDAAPDEFDFNFNGLSGAFFLGSDGKWKVRSANGENIQVQETVGSVPIHPLKDPNAWFNTRLINPTFVQFVLTTGDGTRYIFGGNPTGLEGNTTIEFNRKGPSYQSYDSNLTAVAWHLAEIDLPSGKKITYQYFRDGSQFTYTPHSSCTSMVNKAVGSSGTANGNTIEENDFNLNITDPVYLQSITFPEGQLVFNSTHSGESDILDPWNIRSIRDAFNNAAPADFYPGIYNSFLIWRSYTDVGNSYSYNSQGNITSVWYKLNDIELHNYNGSLLKDFQLKYTQDSNTRLFLHSVQEITSGSLMPPYTFDYNQLQLPAYCTPNTDHWGFYNGPKTFPGWTFDSNSFVTTTFQNQYYQFREPDPTYAQAGILTKITYPSGGNSQFYYEMNQYSKWVGFPISINQTSVNMNGGGLRIKTIISNADFTSAPITYEYKYVTDLVSNVSSGVLGMPRPNYAQNDQVGWTALDSNGNPTSMTFSNTAMNTWDSNLIYPSQNDDGNIVTYSKVVELQSNNGVYNGKKVTVFSNHDNGYWNNPPDHIAVSMNSAVQQMEASNRSFERGKVLIDSIFDQNNNLVKIVQNTYNTDATRFNQYVGGIMCNMKMYLGAAIVPFGGGATNFSWVYSANNSQVRFYTFYPYLQQTTETDYASNHSGQTTSTTTSYSYDQVNGTRNLVKTSKTDSKGQLLTTSVKYPLDYNLSGITPGDAFANGIANLQNLSAISLPVESTTQVSNADGTNLRTISSYLNSFHATLPYPNLTYKASITNPGSSFTSSSISSQGTLVKDGTYEPRTSIDNFDAAGNILQEHMTNGVNQSYQWGYNNNYLVAIVKNATNTYQSSTNLGVKNFFFDSFEEGDGNSTPGDSKTGAHSYDGTTTPFVKTVSNIDNGSYTLTYWQKNNGVWSWISQPVTISGNSYSISLSGQIDDVRLFPVNAQMTTYTYDVMFGLTSITDAKGEITYYDYDQFFRLKNIKDKDKNIIKHILYNYANLPSNADLPISVNTITGTYVSLYWGQITTAPCTSGYLQYTDLTTQTTYQRAIDCGASGANFTVPTWGRTYRFVLIYNMVDGSQVVSIPTDIYVPSY